MGAVVAAAPRPTVSPPPRRPPRNLASRGATSPRTSWPTSSRCAATGSPLLKPPPRSPPRTRLPRPSPRPKSSRCAPSPALPTCPTTARSTRATRGVGPRRTSRRARGRRRRPVRRARGRRGGRRRRRRGRQARRPSRRRGGRRQRRAGVAVAADAAPPAVAADQSLSGSRTRSRARPPRSRPTCSGERFGGGRRSCRRDPSRRPLPPLSRPRPRPSCGPPSTRWSRCSPTRLCRCQTAARPRGGAATPRSPRSRPWAPGQRPRGGRGGERGGSVQHRRPLDSSLSLP